MRLSLMYPNSYIGILNLSALPLYHLISSPIHSAAPQTSPFQLRSPNVEENPPKGKMSSPNYSPADLRADLERDGFILIKSLLTPAQLTPLRQASAEAVALARSGQWPHVRTVGKQFPPWSASDIPFHGIWGVQHLLNPSLPHARLFAETYFSSAVLDIAKALLDCADDELVMELFNMLVRPETDFALRWHRDDIPAGASDEGERLRLAEPAFHAQYNLALYEDSSLVVVPGSHRRARTATERGADPMADHLPGQVEVRMEAGDIVFYDNNILHRGVYDASKERMTLHGSIGHVRGQKLRARNVLQHGVGAWVGECDFGRLGGGGPVGERAEGMRRRLVEMGRDGTDLGYSLVG